MIVVSRDDNEFCLVQVQLIIALWLLTSFESICKFILEFLIIYMCVFFEFSFEPVVISLWFPHELVK